MSETLYIRDVDVRTKASLSAAAEKAGMSLAAYVRMKLDEIAGIQRREAGTLREVVKAVGEPVDGWGPLDEGELARWESGDEPIVARHT